MTAGARRYGRWCREHLETTTPSAPPGPDGSDSLPGKEEVQDPAEDATAGNTVAE
jgi:hypothetical protein